MNVTNSGQATSLRRKGASPWAIVSHFLYGPLLCLEVQNAPLVGRDRSPTDNILAKKQLSMLMLWMDKTLHQLAWTKPYTGMKHLPAGAECRILSIHSVSHDQKIHHVPSSK